MPKTWFVVLSQSSMKLFTLDKDNKLLAHMRTFMNPLVNLKAKDLSRHRVGPGATPPHDLVVQNFALKMARYLDGERKRKAMADLHIAAEPRFAGLLRKALPRETLKIVKGWVHKDLVHADNRRLAKVFVKR